MKKLLLTAGAAAVVVGGGAAVANHYDQYQNKQQSAQDVAVANAKKAQANLDKVASDQLIKANASLRVECAKGEAAYVKLPLVLQKVTPKPVCAPTVSAQ